MLVYFKNRDQFFSTKNTAGSICIQMTHTSIQTKRRRRTYRSSKVVPAGNFCASRNLKIITFYSYTTQTHTWYALFSSWIYIHYWMMLLLKTHFLLEFPKLNYRNHSLNSLNGQGSGVAQLVRPPSLTVWVPSPGTTCWKERTESSKLSSDHQGVPRRAHTYTCLQIY